MLESTLAAIIIFLVSSSGAAFNALAMLTVLRSPHLMNAFGALCFSHTIANFGTLLVFIVWVFPATLWQFDNTATLFGRILGQLQMLFWNACCYSHLAISFNRVISIAMPTKAPQLFAFRPTALVIGFIWTIAIAHITPYFWYTTCFAAYSPETWTWMWGNTLCGYVITIYTDYYTSVAIFAMMSSVDLITLTLLIAYHKRAASSSTASKSHRKMEIRFFMQSSLQGLIFFYEVFNFYYVTTLHTNRWFIFFTSTFAWMLCHCLDGLVVVIFHFRRRTIRRESKIASVATITIKSRIE
ncbi:unnamed protein product [Caenorhabditis bovis]|uniref:G-protein coupled receptors family 1 profile domain-containing protein n=1 Tax=Caenorhabditis bovis TaxID=2654633 RepID=A0A8S1EZV0_9PELO|nr:unnamed protein product [Caenorhabditis bovis]